MVQQQTQIAALVGALQTESEVTTNALRERDAARAVPPVSQASEGAQAAKLGKQPPMFAGSPEQWGEWSFKIRRYLGAVDPDMRRELDEAERQPEDPLLDDMDSPTLARARRLSYILTMFTEGKALDRVRNASEPDNGYSIWRSFVLHWEPRVKGRFRVMLRRIIGFKFDGGPVAEKLEEWERLVRDYVQ